MVSGIHSAPDPMALAETPEESPSAAGRRPPWQRLLLALAFVPAIALVGFGVPILWLLVAAVIQGEAGQMRMTTETALAIFPGICITYALVAYLAGALAARLSPSQGRATRTIHPWMRSMRDEPTRPDPPTGLEMVFILAAVALSAAFLIWFFAWAGSPLPN